MDQVAVLHKDRTPTRSELATLSGLQAEHRHPAIGWAARRCVDKCRRTTASWQEVRAEGHVPRTVAGVKSQLWLAPTCGDFIDPQARGKHDALIVGAPRATYETVLVSRRQFTEPDRAAAVDRDSLEFRGCTEADPRAGDQNPPIAPSVPANWHTGSSLSESQPEAGAHAKFIRPSQESASFLDRSTARYHNLLCAEDVSRHWTHQSACAIGSKLGLENYLMRYDGDHVQA